MPKQGLSQEKLKWIACAAMLLDHIGVLLVLPYKQAAGAELAVLEAFYQALRTVGRLAFPIYCFLLVEGVFHTRNPKRYGIRLLLGALLSEIPYDLAFYGAFTWEKQSVMVTLFLGFLMLEVMKHCRNLLKLPPVILTACLAQLLHTDYGAKGILLMALFALTRELKYREVLQFFGLWCIFSPNHLMMFGWQNGITISLQELAVLALIPIWLYSGQKNSSSRALQWAFYLFYPAHLLILYLNGAI